MKAHLTRSEADKVKLAQEFCDYLNELIELDRDAIHNLVETRVHANDELGRHPTAQLSRESADEPLGIGALGLLNGVIGVDADGWGYVAGVYDDQGELQRFELSSRFASTRRESSKPESD